MQKRLKNTDLVNQPRLSFFDKCWGTTVGHQISKMKRKTKTKNEWTKNMVKKMYRWIRMPMYTVHLAISARIYLSLHRDNYLCVHLVISVNTSTCFSKDAENLTTYGYVLWCSQIVCTCHFGACLFSTFSNEVSNVLKLELTSSLLGILLRVIWSSLREFSMLNCCVSLKVTLATLWKDLDRETTQNMG